MDLSIFYFSRFKSVISIASSGSSIPKYATIFIATFATWKCSIQFSIAGGISDGCLPIEKVYDNSFQAHIIPSSYKEQVPKWSVWLIDKSSLGIKLIIYNSACSIVVFNSLLPKPQPPNHSCRWTLKANVNKADQFGRQCTHAWKLTR